MKPALQNLKSDAVRIPLFILLCCLLTLISMLLFKENNTIATTALMTMPALSALLTRLITGEKGLKELFVGFRGKFRYYAMGYYLPIAALALGALLYYLLYPAHFDPGMGRLALYTDIPAEHAKWLYRSGLFFLPLVFAFVFYLADPLGWLGYLLPKLLRRFKVLPATIILGIAWSVPLFIHLSFYDGDNVLNNMGGLLNLVAGPGAEDTLLSIQFEYMLMYLLMSAFLVRLTTKTRSCFPAILGYIAIWQYDRLWGDFLAVGVEDHPLSYFITWGPMIALCVFSMLQMMKEEREGRLLPPEPEPVIPFQDASLVNKPL